MSARLQRHPGQRRPREAPLLVTAIDIDRYPKVNEYASAPGSLKVISTVRSRTPSC
jgi:hypothetical protein